MRRTQRHSENESENWPNERKKRRNVYYLASLVCDAACMEQTRPAKLEHYVNEMILASMILYVTKIIYFQFILRSLFL